MITLFYDNYSTFEKQPAPSRRIMGETQWREAEASGCSFARSPSARLRRSFACSPDNTAKCAGYSFIPKTTFSVNFLIEHFRSKQGYRTFGFMYCYSACMPQGNKRRGLLTKKALELKILSILCY